MSAFVGRLLTVIRNDTGPGPATFTGVMTKAVSIDNGEIDITSDDDSGFRTLLEAAAVKKIDISMEGILKDDQVLSLVAAGPIQGNYIIDFGVIGTIVGDFQIDAMEIPAEHSAATKYSVTLKSTGSYAYTPDSTA